MFRLVIQTKLLRLADLIVAGTDPHVTLLLISPPSAPLS